MTAASVPPEPLSDPVTAPMSAPVRRPRSANANGFAERWESTPVLARQFGVPLGAVMAAIREGRLRPTFRTDSGQARWRRSDFAAQVMPWRLRNVPPPVPQPNGTTVWRRLGLQVIAQPGRSVLVAAAGAELLLDPSMAELLVAVLPDAAAIAAEPAVAR